MNDILQRSDVSKAAPTWRTAKQYFQWQDAFRAWIETMNQELNLLEPKWEVSTTQADLPVTVLGYDEPVAALIGSLMKKMVTRYGRHFDLSGLDGVTVANDYSKALLDLDRGYSTTHKLTASSTYCVGVAMSPSVMRNGVHKSHLLFSANHLLGLIEAGQEASVINLIAHECAHVEAKYLFDAAFPGILLQKEMDTLDALRWDQSLACWDEYTACWLSARFGPVHAGEYEPIFLSALSDTREKANASIIAYRLNSDISRVIREVTGGYGTLLMYGAYHLGNIEGNHLTWREMPGTVAALTDHWFLPYFEALDDACKALKEAYGCWKSDELFRALGDLAEQVLADGGMEFYRNDDGTVGVSIPLTPETTPDISRY